MEQVVQAFIREDGEMRIPVLRLEIDYELATLHDALLDEDLLTIKQTKQRLEQLRQELILLEV
ncbi:MULTISPECIES: hypothetical protein [Bacillaceae]|uniref:Uncharacterized protein n=1 Tax=Halalkalibacter alkaliphilus TaxID=2917993 RepID=A0A9X2A1T2_9BACI|nr:MULTISPECIES: hypothetical protein [Bacillaceae]MCL7746315.1 hypothetical protein [Halalkalibacter alkaliphilus]MDT8859178.1 hypothetical protein [Alkalihalobacillus sp. MEB130]